MKGLFWCLPLNEWLSETGFSVTEAAKKFKYSTPYMYEILNNNDSYVINGEIYVKRREK